MPADLPLPREGDIVTYDHPDWGRCSGEVLRPWLSRQGEGLVQDLDRHGAREWIPWAWLVEVARG